MLHLDIFNNPDAGLSTCKPNTCEAILKIPPLLWPTLHDEIANTDKTTIKGFPSGK